MNNVLYENRFQITEDISNRKLQKLCRYYKIHYSKNKERTIQKLQYVLNKKKENIKNYKINNQEECVICYKVLTDKMLITRCLHAYCDECIIKYLNLYSESCPICRKYYDSYWFIYDKQIKEEDLNKLIIENTIPQIIESGNDNSLEEIEQLEPDHFYLYYIYNFVCRYRCIEYLIILYLMKNLLYL